MYFYSTIPNICTINTNALILETFYKQMLEVLNAQ
jgi:hypothetical protein